ncbi:MAG TPA: hypothetical protein VIK60_01955 [Vicinamibacterales bacterium]
MSVTTTVSQEDEFAERWRQWQLGNAKSSRKGEIQARIAFALVVTVVLTWLSLRLL